MRLAKALDLALRGAAIVTAIVAAPIVWMAGIVALIARSAAMGIVGMLFIVGGTGLLVLLIHVSSRPPRFLAVEGQSRRGNPLLVTAIVYFVGTAGLVVIAGVLVERRTGRR